MVCIPYTLYRVSIIKSGSYDIYAAITINNYAAGFHENLVIAVMNDGNYIYYKISFKTTT